MRSRKSRRARPPPSKSTRTSRSKARPSSSSRRATRSSLEDRYTKPLRAWMGQVLLEVRGLVEAPVALAAGVRAHVLVGDARVLVERLLVAEGLRALRALERLLAEVHRLEVGPHDAGAREDLGALGARLGGHGCELLASMPLTL